MEEKYLGKIISYERRKKKISLEQLSTGLLSPRTLRRIEDGERISSYFILERIMERLGKSMNKMDFLLHEKDYEIYYLRGKIEKEVEEERIEEACYDISCYEALSLAKEPLHYQYLCKMKAVVFSLKNQGREAIELLEKAIGITLLWWKNLRIEEGELCLGDILAEYPMGKEEISLLLLWMQQMWKEGKEIYVDGRELLHNLSRYYEEDEEERADLYSKVCWVLGSFCLKQKEMKEAYYFTSKGEQILAENKILLHLPQYLDRLVSLEEEIPMPYRQNWREQRDALKDVLLAYGKHWETGEIQLWKNMKIQELYLVSEVVQQERRIRKRTKEMSALDMGIDTKTLSRLEAGSAKPKVETWKKIKDYYEISRDVCSTRIVTEDFKLLEMERKISVLHHLNKEDEAEKLYLKLKKKLDVKWKENRQYILYQDMFYDHQLRKISHEEALERCRKAFHVTRPYLEFEEIDQVTLSRMECKILNYMCICYRKMGYSNKTTSLLEKAVHGYKNSKVDSKYYFYSLGLLYLNLIDNYEESNQFEKALGLCEEAIHYEIDCDKCSDLGYLISVKQYIIDRRNGEFQTDGKKCYRQAFQLMKLMKREVLMKELQIAHKEWYGEELD